MNTSTTMPAPNSFMNFDENNSNYDQRFARMINSIFEAGAVRANNRIGNTEEEKRTREVKSDGGYKCIHLPINSFISMLCDVIRHHGWTLRQIERLKFLDVGCGVGQKVFLAQMLGFQSYGLELRKELIEEGNSLFQTVCGNRQYWGQKDESLNAFIQGNALEFDRYGDFDIIYFYCPLFNRKMQQTLEERIAKTAKAGTIVIGALPQGVFSPRGYGYCEENPKQKGPTADELGWEYITPNRNNGSYHNYGFYVSRKLTYDI